MLKAVEEVWRANPDLRFGQLLVTATNLSGRKAVSPEVFSLEDEDLLRGVQALAARTKNEKKAEPTAVRANTRDSSRSAFPDSLAACGSALTFGKTMKLAWREASGSDVGLLADWNHQLIRDEGHRNAMTVEQLSERMKKWLSGEYRAVLFSEVDPVGYALFKNDEELIYLRQFFVRRDRRRSGIGRAAFEILRREIWPSGIRLTVDVLCRNADGVAFWRSVGYQDYCLTLEIMP